MSNPPSPPASASASLLRATLALTGVAAALFVVTTWYALGPYFRTFNTPHTAIEGVPHEPSKLPPTPGLTRRLVFVIVDGLSMEAARSLDELGPLRRAGVLRPLHAEFPTFTSPALTAWVTGLSPRDSGTRLNGGLHSAEGLDSVLEAAGEARMSVRLRTREWEPLPELMRPPKDADIRVGKVGLMAELLAQALPDAPRPAPIDGRSPAREISVVYIGEVDEVGHEHGARSRDYTEAAHVAANLVNRVADTLDLEQDTLIVASDHGHRPEGGHGGHEPETTRAFLLAAGGFVRRGVELAEPRPMRDVASTLSVIAGLRVPSSNLGRPMLDLLALNDQETSFVLAAPFDQAAHFLCRLSPAARCAEVDPLVERLHKADPAAWEQAVALHDELTLARDKTLAVAGQEQDQRRLALTAAALLVVAAAAAFASRRRWLRIDPAHALDPASWIPPVANVGVYASVLAAAFAYRPTFSTMKAAPLFLKDATPPAIAAVVAVAALGWWTRPARLAPWILLIATVIPYALLAAWVGCDPARLPPPITGVLVFELGPAVLSATVAAVVLAWIGLRRSPGAWGRLRPHR